MYTAKVLLICCLALLVVWASSQVLVEAQERPSLPEKFENPTRLKDYLKKLKEFHDIAGRGRYGKRFYNKPTAPEDSNPGITPSRADWRAIYQYLLKYN